MPKEVIRDEETIAAVKALKSEKRRQAVGNVIKYIAKNALPKGIRNPDDMVVNRHLYFGVKRGQKPPKTRLF
jgi:hypothetical protein